MIEVGPEIEQNTVASNSAAAAARCHIQPQKLLSRVSISSKPPSCALFFFLQQKCRSEQSRNTVHRRHKSQKIFMLEYYQQTITHLYQRAVISDLPLVILGHQAAPRFAQYCHRCLRFAASSIVSLSGKKILQPCRVIRQVMEHFCLNGFADTYLRWFLFSTLCWCLGFGRPK